MTLIETVRQARKNGDSGAIIHAIPYARYLNIQLSAESDVIEFELPFATKWIGNNSLPAIHGGVIAGFLETSALVFLLIDQDHTCFPKIINFSVDYLRSAGAKNTFSRCTITRKGRRVVHLQVYCWQDTIDKPVALARAHFLIETPASDT